jgi:putative restriction endonuclease
MGHAVFLHRADSIYDDEPDVVYDFPRTYLRAVEETVGDWIVYYEPVKAGPRGYFAVAKVAEVIEKPDAPGRFLALIEAGSFLPFDSSVPRLKDGRPRESLLADARGAPVKGGRQQLAVRRLPAADFAAIVNAGLPEDLEAQEARRFDPAARRSEFDTAAAPFLRPVQERLTRRAYRDVAFRRRVREAYGYRCAMSGLELRNGGGRPEVQAAHIRPVAAQGSDSVRNGLALSGTLHWMFDRGLLAVTLPDPAQEHDMRILVSENKVPREVVDRLLLPDRRLHLPRDKRDWPSPAALQWHREHRFGQGDFTPRPT